MVQSKRCLVWQSLSVVTDSALPWLYTGQQLQLNCTTLTRPLFLLIFLPLQQARSTVPRCGTWRGTQAKHLSGEGESS